MKFNKGEDNITLYSHSRIGTFEKCRLAYRLRYIDRIKVDFTTIEAYLGTCVHEALERFHSDLNSGKTIGIDELLRYFHAVWERDWKDSIHIDNPDLDKSNYLIRGETYLVDYYTRNFLGAGRALKIIVLENDERMMLPDGNEYAIRIDKLGCLGDDFFVCDYKTSTRHLQKETAMADRQLAMYALWVHQTYPNVRKVVQRWHMLHFNKDVDVEHTMAELLAVQQSVMEKIAEIEGCQDFPAIESPLCGYCEYKGMCPDSKNEEKKE